MKMTGIEKGVLVAIGVLIVSMIALVVIANRAIDREFEGCKGLKGAVEKVWEGTECESR